MKFAGMHFGKFSLLWDYIEDKALCLHISSHYSPIRINGRNDVLSRSNTISRCGKMYMRARNSQLYVKRDSSRRSLFIIQGNNGRTLKINDRNSVKVSSSSRQAFSNCSLFLSEWLSCHKISNLNPNPFMYTYNNNCKTITVFIIFAIFFASFSQKKKALHKKKISLSKVFFLEMNRNLTQEFVKGLSLQVDSRFSRSLLEACRFHASLRFISKRILMRMSGWFGHSRERYIDVGVTKLSATPEKNTAVLPTQKYALCYDEGLDERERKWQSTAGITLRFLPHCAVRRRSFRRVSCPRVVGGNIEKISLSLSPLFTVFVFLSVVSSSRLITTRGILFQNGENDAAAGHAKGNLKCDTSAVARTSKAVIHSVVCRQPRLLSARWFIFTREMK